MKVARGVVGVFAGYGVVVLVLRFFGPGPTGSGMNYFIVSALWTVAGAFLGGFVTAWIAGKHELPFASALGMALIATSMIAMRREGASRPGWYETSVAGCGPVAALVGAAVRMLVKRR